ncbi:MAG: polyprenyl synthetase family protein [Clostridium sp.]
MIGGQVDVKSTGDQISGEKLNFIYKLKTGALIEASMMIGAVLAGAAREQVNAVEEIAGKVGLAFQIQDDILDVTSTAEELGKPIHSDEKNEKTTYVTWKGIDGAKALSEKISREALQQLESLGAPDEYLAQLLESLINRSR